MLKILFTILSLMLFLPLPTGANNRVVRLADQGVMKKILPTDRYKLMYRLHEQAKKNSDIVSYQGIDSLVIEMPKGVKPIKLGYATDFCGAKI